MILGIAGIDVHLGADNLPAKTTTVRVVKRVQRQRAKGWKMPSNTVYVGRPSRWGNPLTLRQDRYGKWVIAWHQLSDEDNWAMYSDDVEDYAHGLDRLVSEYESLHDRDMYNGSLADQWDAWIAPLIGKDLACWCPLDQPCHADVLLRWACESSKRGGEVAA